jgi:hypothetical protein
MKSVKEEIRSPLVRLSYKICEEPLIKVSEKVSPILYKVVRCVEVKVDISCGRILPHLRNDINRNQLE